MNTNEKTIKVILAKALFERIGIYIESNSQFEKFIYSNENYDYILKFISKSEALKFGADIRLASNLENLRDIKNLDDAIIKAIKESEE